MAHNAKAGGEVGANGEFYKGGQFVADKADTVKGSSYTYVDRSFDARVARELEWSNRSRIIAEGDLCRITASRLWKSLSNHVGEVGEKVEAEVELVDLFSFEGCFGTTTVAKFRDDDGNLMVWFTSRFPNRGSKPVADVVHRLENGSVWRERAHDEPTFWECGDRMVLRGTVKSHDWYDGERQTTVTRCKLNETR